jgi:hypothetical protein
MQGESLKEDYKHSVVYSMVDWYPKNLNKNDSIMDGIEGQQLHERNQEYRHHLWGYALPIT